MLRPVFHQIIIVQCMLLRVSARFHQQHSTLLLQNFLVRIKYYFLLPHSLQPITSSHPSIYQKIVHLPLLQMDSAARFRTQLVDIHFQ
jgi:hypothetical protein